jgi:opacity protein-like surface antigen
MVRGMYRFSGDGEAEPYLYGGAGYWSIKEESIDFRNLQMVKRTTTFPSYTIGAGIEYAHERIPNAAANVEIGFMSTGNNSLSFQFSTITYGAGLHYYFLR